MNDKHKFILEIPIFNIDEAFPIVKDYYKTNDPINILNIAQSSKCDILGLKFNISTQEEIPLAVELLKTLLPYIKKPLMIRGINNDEIDKKLLPALLKVLDRKCIVAFATENTYQEITPEIIKGGHKLVIRTPIDINLAKEMNILTHDLGLSLENIIIDTDIGGLGYGLEYGYSIMEKIKIEKADEYLNLPLISFAAEESLKTKEAKTDNFSPSYGDLKSRAIMYEISAASSVMAAGANYIVINYPPNIEVMKEV